MPLPIDEDKIVDFVNARVESSKEGSHRRAFMTNFDVYRRAYEGQFKNKLPKEYSQFFVRLAFSTVDTLLAYFYESLFSNYPLAKFSARNAEDMARSNAVQHVMDYEIYHRNYIDRCLSALNWVLKYGIVVTYNYWRYDVGNRKRTAFNEILPGLKIPSTVEESYILHDQPSFKILDPRRFYPDPNAGTLETENGLSVECGYAAHDEMGNFANLVNMQTSGKYFNLDKLHADGSFNPEVGEKLVPTPTNEEEVSDDYQKRVSIRHYWGPLSVRVRGTSALDFVPGDYDQTMYWVQVANEKRLIHFRSNPYYHGQMPYEIGNIFKADDSLYAEPAISAILANQDIMNMLINLRLDNIHNLVNPSPVVWRNGLEDKDHFKHKIPGEPAYVNLPEDLNRIINYPTMPDVGSSPYMQMFDQMKGLAMECVPANPINMGVIPKSRRTATEVGQVSGAATVRFKKMGFVFSNTWMSPTLRQFVQLLQQFSTVERNGKIMGESEEKYVTYTPEEIQGETDVEVMDASVGNEELVSQAYTNLLAAMAPYFQTGQLNAEPALRGVLENMPLIKNANEIIQRAMTLNEKEVAQIQQMAPGVMEAVMQARNASKGINAPGAPGTGQNGGGQSMGPQPEMAGGAVKMGM